jgi:hypothetical protein
MAYGYPSAIRAWSRFWLTVVPTCRQRGLDMLRYLTTRLRARLDGSPAPPLLE